MRPKNIFLKKMIKIVFRIHPAKVSFFAAIYSSVGIGELAIWNPKYLQQPRLWFVVLGAVCQSRELAISPGGHRG